MRRKSNWDLIIPEIDDLVVTPSNRSLVGRVFALDSIENRIRVLIVWSTNLQDLADTFEAMAGATLQSADMVDVADLEYVERWDYWTTK